jgi:hypothetical protein
MNDLKESNEIIKQTTDELKKQQEELKNIVDMLNKEKDDWVLILNLFIYFNFIFLSKAKKSDIENLDEKIRNLQNLLVRNPFLKFL